MLAASRLLRFPAAILVAIAIIATGAPLAEIHAHDGGGDAGQIVPADPLHDHPTPDRSQHLHEQGLFANAPGAAAPEHGMAIPEGAAGHFADLVVPDARSHHSPLLRPPAR